MIFRRSLTILGIAALLACPTHAIAQASPPVTDAAPVSKPILADAEKEKDIRQLFALTGSDKIGQQMMEQLIPEMQKSQPQIPTEFWEGIRIKIKAGGLTERLVPVYDKYYTKEEVKALVAFYQTPLGAKVTATLPGITQDSQAVGAAWGQEIAQEVIQELQAVGATKPSAKAAPKSGKPRKSPASKAGKTASK
jgi:hypothetical protein